MPKAKHKSPLRYDPSRTAALRRKFAAEVKRRFSFLRQAIRKLFVDEDALGLRQRISPILNTRWKFSSNPEKVKAFQKWLAKQIADKVAGANEEQLWQKYTEAGFKKGAGRSFDDFRASEKAQAAGIEHKMAHYAGTKEEFLRSSFAAPEAVDTVKLLAGRSFDDLKGVTTDMSNRMSRSLTDGLVQGKGPREIAKDLAEDVDLGESRALLVARTEIIRAHAEGQLTALENLGVEELGVEVEWSATGDDRVCPLCEDLDGEVFSIQDAHGMLPRHPQCRCSWLAHLPDDTKPEPTENSRQPVYNVASAVDEFSQYLVNAFNPDQARDMYGRWTAMYERAGNNDNLTHAHIDALESSLKELSGETLKHVAKLAGVTVPDKSKSGHIKTLVGRIRELKHTFDSTRPGFANSSHGG